MRVSSTIQTLICLTCLTWSLETCAEIVVIVNQKNPVQTMTPRQISDLYLGRTRHFDTGKGNASLAAVVYEQPKNSPLREAFFHALNGMSVDRVNAYWARLRFSGEVLPPKTLTDSLAALETVQRDRNAISYVDSSVVSKSVKIVLRLKD